MEIIVKENPVELGKSAGKTAAKLIRQAIAINGSGNIILATGISQFETLKQLIVESGMDWGKITMFHLD